MFSEILFTIWFFLPAGAANAIPVFISKLPYLKNYNYPLDFNKKFRGKRVFGSHKTWRGLFAGILFSTFVLYLQKFLILHFSFFNTINYHVDYRHIPVLIVGPLFGLGSLGGDAIESFFKRQVGIQPGGSWFPFDQTDYIIGGAIATASFFHIRFYQYLVLLLIWLINHIVASSIGFILGLKERPI